METEKGMLVMLASCVIVLLIIFFRQRAELILNFMVRSILGAMGIYGMNMLLAQIGISGGVGINFISLLTVGSLGTSGLGLLYGIFFYNML